MGKSVLAFDFGASSGRAMLGSFEDGKIKLKEIHRFENTPVSLNGTLYWDFLNLFQNVKTGILKAKVEGGFDSIGIDTWAVDFGLIDENGDLLQNPVHYRDSRTVGAMEKVFALVPKETVYEETGIQFMRINTLFQLAVLAEKDPEILARADKMLMIPDLFNFYLTGEKKVEYTNATSTQMLNPCTGQWCWDILEKNINSKAYFAGACRFRYGIRNAFR